MVFKDLKWINTLNLDNFDYGIRDEISKVSEFNLIYRIINYRPTLLSNEDIMKDVKNGNKYYLLGIPEKVYECDSIEEAKRKAFIHYKGEVFKRFFVQ